MERITHQRVVVSEVLGSLRKRRRLIHIVVGPRQVGKTTASVQIAQAWSGPVIRASADEPLPPGPQWIRVQWERAANRRAERPLLILDEIQKVQGWSESVKALWDAEQTERRPLAVLLLGSSSLLLQKGLAESLAGRFFLFRCPHWGYAETRAVFRGGLDRWLYFGGYPGAYALADEEPAWGAYIRDSLIETVLGRDVLQLQTVAKPALLRHLFLFAASAPAQIISYNKMLGQLVDAGNTTTLAHYLRLLGAAFLLTGLEKLRGGAVQKRGSSPKLVLWNNALVSAVSGRGFAESRADPAWWGRLVENAVGAHLLNSLQGLPWEVMYWREGDLEVDYVVRTPRRLLAIEVKSTRSRAPNGLAGFCSRWAEAVPLIVGPGGMPLEEFFSTDPRTLLGG
jgi:predicted AAA+ superfamily ATPase